MWSPDGWGAVTRLGLLIPHADVGPESELEAMAPDDVIIHATRVPFDAMTAGGTMDPTISLEPVRAFAEPPFVDDAAELLAAAPIAAIGFAFTSSAYVIGADGETAMIARLEQRTRGIPVVAPCAAGVAGLRSLGVSRLALVSPPWFDPELTTLGKAYFEGQGLEVVHAESASLPSDQAAIEPELLFEAVCASTPDEADGVFIGGNGFRAVGALEALEGALGRPVVSANQALMWGLLGRAGHRAPIPGYGRLLAGER
jgi:maleate isomerase